MTSTLCCHLAARKSEQVMTLEWQSRSEHTSPSNANHFFFFFFLIAPIPCYNLYFIFFSHLLKWWCYNIKKRSSLLSRSYYPAFCRRGTVDVSSCKKKIFSFDHRHRRFFFQVFVCLLLPNRSRLLPSSKNFLLLLWDTVALMILFFWFAAAPKKLNRK